MLQKVTIYGNFQTIHGAGVMTNALLEVCRIYASARYIDLSLSQDRRTIHKLRFGKIIMAFSLMIKLIIFKPDGHVFIVQNFNFGNSWKLMIIFLKLRFHRNQITSVYLYPHVRLEMQSIGVLNWLKRLYSFDCIVLGLNEKSKYVQLGIKTHVVQNFVDFARVKCFDSKRTFDLIYFGEFCNSKGFDEFMMTILRLDDLCISLEVVIMGRYGNWSESMINSVISNLKNIKCALVVDPTKNQKQYYLIRSRYLIYPSRNDYAPLVILEALASGLIILAYDVGEISYMIQGQGITRSLINDSLDVERFFLEEKSNINDLANLSEYTYGSFALKISSLINFG